MKNEASFRKENEYKNYVTSILLTISENLGISVFRRKKKVRWFLKSHSARSRKLYKQVFKQE